jgi:hypothetical protein
VNHLGAAAALVYRLDRIDSILAPFVGVGPALFATNADVDAGGVKRSQSDTRAGVMGVLGFELLDTLSGLGAVAFELRILHAPTTVPSLPDSSVEPFVASIGYRLFFLP